MRDTAPMRDVPSHWLSWRIGPVPLPTPNRLPPAFRFRATMIDPPTNAPSGPAPADYRDELPDATGIRRGLVAHVRELIAAGRYDTPERWALAEEMMFRTVDGR